MTNSMSLNKSIYSSIDNSIQLATSMFGTIPNERKQLLQKLSKYIQLRINQHKKVELIFICTHNSRRSHFAQIWAQTAAAYFNIPFVYCYSGGTVVTAFNPSAVKALQEAGFSIKQKSEFNNPHYEVKYSDTSLFIDVFSKKYSDAPNPTNSFVAIMTCSRADESCPIVHGAEERFKIPYEDPKIADGRPEQESVYNKRSLQIASEMCYMFSLLIK